MTTRPAVRFGLLFVFPNLLFLAVAFWLPVEAMLIIFNGLATTMALGVCVAYAPAVLSIMFDDHGRIDRGDLLAVGIFCGWFAIIVRSAIQFYWRYLDQPADFLDNYFVLYAIWLMLCGATFHLLAPGTVSSRVPTRRWVTVGIWVAAGGAIILFTLWWTGVLIHEQV
jgi:hypothetical protein